MADHWPVPFESEVRDVKQIWPISDLTFAHSRRMYCRYTNDVLNKSAEYPSMFSNAELSLCRPVNFSNEHNINSAKCQDHTRTSRHQVAKPSTDLDLIPPVPDTGSTEHRSRPHHRTRRWIRWQRLGILHYFIHQRIQEETVCWDSFWRNIHGQHEEDSQLVWGHAHVLWPCRPKLQKHPISRHELARTLTYLVNPFSNVNNCKILHFKRAVVATILDYIDLLL